MNQGDSEPEVREDRNSLLSKSKDYGAHFALLQHKGPRKDQGDLSASLSLSRKDCRYLASPFSVSIVWGTLCYHSVEMTKLNLYRCPNRTSEKSFGRPPARATPAPTFQLFTLQRQVSTRQLLTAAPLIFRDVAGCRHVARPKLTDHDSLDSIGFGPI
ncbi:hypothetical protein V6N13_004726 [Hibiscus sabdariffa]